MLKKIVEAKMKRLEAIPRKSWQKKLDSMLADNPPINSFKRAISARQKLALIAEFKRKAPSAGTFNLKADPVKQANLYRQGGASAISILTEEDFFGGRLDDISLIKSNVDLPVLRKDFILDPLQMKEARAFGADAVLLIVKILGREQLHSLLNKAGSLRLNCLCEVHSEEEIKIALDCGADIIGINNRNLETFNIDLNATRDLMPNIPEEITVVSESGIHNAADARFLRSCGVDAILVGAELMSASDVSQKARELSI